jgi:hypothetical protein
MFILGSSSSGNLPPPFAAEHLQNPALSRKTRLSVITGFGDLVLHAKEGILPYVKGIIKCFDLAMEAGYAIMSSKTIESKERMDELREIIIPAATCVFHGLSEVREAHEDVAVLIQTVYQFLTKAFIKAANPKIVLL